MLQGLIIVAHADDETLFAGALLSYTRNRVKWNVLCITGGLNKTRKAELKSALALVGVKSVTHLNNPDEGDPPSWASDPTHRDKIIKKIRYTATQADFCVTHGHKGEYGHPHHKIVHELCNAALRDLKIPPVALYFGSLRIAFGSKADNTMRAPYKIMDPKAVSSKSKMLAVYKSQKANLEAIPI